MKKYPQYTKNVSATSDGKIAFFSDGEIRKTVKSAEKEAAQFGGRIIARPSGTEPYIRVMAEGEDEKKTRELAERVALAIKVRLESYEA